MIALSCGQELIGILILFVFFAVINPLVISVRQQCSLIHISCLMISAHTITTEQQVFVITKVTQFTKYFFLMSSYCFQKPRKLVRVYRIAF